MTVVPIVSRSRSSPESSAPPLPRRRLNPWHSLYVARFTRVVPLQLLILKFCFFLHILSKNNISGYRNAPIITSDISKISLLAQDVASIEIFCLKF